MSVNMDINDFLEAIKKEIGSVRYIVTDAKFNKIFDNAKETVLEEMKNATKPVANRIPLDNI